ncbi:hypothetical protein QJQ45_024127 [Haematococcus lacustris]|nr:hypothetical protein QJQ45_024127 [Haematococcus lacustris]
MPDTVKLNVKWSGQEFALEFADSDTLADVRQKLEECSGVAPKRQKLLGLKTKANKPAEDGDTLSSLALKPGLKVMMIGTSETVIQATQKEAEAAPQVQVLGYCKQGKPQALTWQQQQQQQQGQALTRLHPPSDDFDLTEEQQGSLEVKDQPEVQEKLARRLRSVEVKILNPPRPGKKCLVLDIDYTLFDLGSSAERPEELARPYLHEFLAAAWEHYDIIIWSATGMKWVEVKMKELGVSTHPAYKLVCMLDHSAMLTVSTEKYGVFECKPLAFIWSKFPGQYHEHNTIMFDDLRRNYIMNKQAGLVIRPFKRAHLTRHTDKELYHLTRYLLLIAPLERISHLDHSRWERYLAKHGASDACVTSSSASNSVLGKRCKHCANRLQHCAARREPYRLLTSGQGMHRSAGLRRAADPTLTFPADLQLLKMRLKLAAQSIQPAICKRDTTDIMILQPQEYPSMQPHRVTRAHQHQPQPINPLPKLSRAVKSKSNGAGRQYTSRFRGVHQTFPTKRWEAQFRRNGKPTSLGCFDLEEEAARAYDKMMLWCELHNTAGVKGGITNYDPPEYDKELAWLQSITQDELIEALRSDGRRQAAHRMLRQKRDSGPTRSTRARSSRLDHATDRDGSGDHGGGRTSSAAGDSMWLDRDTNSCLNFQRIGESMQRPLELCSYEGLNALPPIGKEYQQGYKRVNDRLPKTAAQVRAAKALKQQQQLQQQQTAKAKPGQQSSANTAGGPSPKPAHVSVPAAPSNAAGLPADFFQSSRKESTAVASASVAPRPASSTAQPAAPVAPVKPPPAGTQQGNTRAPTAAAALPQGFFSDKEADAKARGVKLPDAKQKEHKFQEFQQMLEAELKTAAALEADAAEEEAEDRREREDFVQWVRMQRLEELKKRKELAAPVIAAEASEPPDETLSVAEELLEVSTVAPGVAGAVLSSLAPAAKRRRVLDTLLELQNDEEDEEGVDGADEDPLLNWRAKGVMSLRKTAAPAPSTSPASKTATRASPMEVAQIASEASFITGTALTMVAMTLVGLALGFVLLRVESLVQEEQK